MNYTKITTWEEACKVHGYDPNNLPDVSTLPENFKEWLIATYKMGIITEAVNTNEKGKVWTPDWSNHDQWKYFPWFEIKASKKKPSGVGFSCSLSEFWATCSIVGSRLCFERREQVKHVQEHFEDLFLKIHLIQD